MHSDGRSMRSTIVTPKRRQAGPQALPPRGRSSFSPTPISAMVTTFR